MILLFKNTEPDTHTLWPVAALMMLQLKQQPAAYTVSPPMIPDSQRASPPPICVLDQLI